MYIFDVIKRCFIAPKIVCPFNIQEKIITEKERTKLCARSAKFPYTYTYMRSHLSSTQFQHIHVLSAKGYINTILVYLFIFRVFSFPSIFLHNEGVVPMCEISIFYCHFLIRILIINCATMRYFS